MSPATRADHAPWSGARPAEPRSDHEAPRPRGGLPLARIAGVEIVADWSLLVIFTLVAVNLGWGILPRWHPTWSPALVWLVALAAAFLFFASIVAHELSHAIVARWTGTPVHRITLFLFGGVAHLTREPSSPKAELVTAAIGPIVSLAIGVGATIGGALLAGDALARMPYDPAATYAALGPVATLLLWLGPVNVVLALFNLVPGFPLDGGRVLRAILWWSTGDLRKATRWASGAGRVVGIGLVAWGLVTMLSGGFFSGVWLALIGWFLMGAATSSYRQLVVRDALESVPVTRLMRTDVETVAPEVPIDRLVDELLLHGDQQSFPVVHEGAIVGIVGVRDVRRVPRSEWPSTPVSAIMTPRERLVSIEPGASASRALERLAASEIEQLPVVHGARLVGAVHRRDILKWVALTEPEIPA